MIDDILNRLEKVKKTGDSKWIGCCPAHEDDDPSLAISVISDGRILIHCFAGCSPSDILAAIGLSMTDLFPDGALAQELRGATPWIRSARKQVSRDRDKAELLLKIIASDREKGKQLTPADLDAERKAWLAVNSSQA